MKVNNSYTYLALGDSYTIGEGLPITESFPFQTMHIFNENKIIEMENPKIIAVTGWTTDELAVGIRAENIEDNTYDFVSLLIGVNNQYRGRTVVEFQAQFEDLLLQAIDFADEKTERVFVLSIPDWGVTPFALEKGMNPEQIATEIDSFNAAVQQICRKHQVRFIDITTSSRIFGKSKYYLVEDKLHYAAHEYGRWANRLAIEMKDQLNHESEK